MSDHPELEKQRGSRKGRLAPERREELIAAFQEVRERVQAAGPEEPSPVLSQGWVDRRRLVLVDLILTLCEEVMRGETLGARELAERLHPVLTAAQELAPGYSLGKAAALVLAALEEGEPGLEVD
ncbi:hypothetical protein [Melittangium boletus]|uniref:Uncharacterized protein n=1 Tax=Melittangium boletus DSM 14713 TaxID=1294270 RepID=A0A250IFV8_9BACT|nr:hypothetical protein [Melittangium boletus]ATB30031.1 hypothetical protein MEBOL_003486 [Melittangium boletus DSM 14713]